MKFSCPLFAIKRCRGLDIEIFGAVWSESLQPVFWMAKDAQFLQADDEDSDQTARMHWFESSLGIHVRMYVFLHWALYRLEVVFFFFFWQDIFNFCKQKRSSLVDSSQKSVRDLLENADSDVCAKVSTWHNNSIWSSLYIVTSEPWFPFCCCYFTT